MVTGRIGICFFQLALLTKYYTIFLCLAFVPVSTQDDKTTCSIPSVERFQDTVLTCHFPEDLSVTKKDFTIYLYVEQGTPDSVLDCWWIRGSQECYSKPGFTFDKRISRFLNLKMDRVDDEHVGRYACQIAGYGSTSLGTCEFMLKLDAHNTCKITKENNHSQMNLTCFFNEDIEKTQKNFTVFEHNEEEKLIAVDCWWEHGNQRCRREKGYLYDEKVSTYINMAIPTTSNKKTYNYSCWHGGSYGYQVKTCSFVIDSNEKYFDTLALGTTLGILALFATAIAGIVLLMRKRRKKLLSLVRKEEEFPMVSFTKQPEKVTEDFKSFLLEAVKNMYPNMLNSCYFVPPVYFNKIRYSIRSVADQIVYAPDPPNVKDIIHDRAMQHVIHCLHRMGEHYREQMFVLTQFSYDDYLRCPGNDYVAADLNDMNSKLDIECFDFLIIHRHHGMVVGVVKTLSDKDDCSEDGEKKTDEQLISEVSEGLRQLQRAQCRIQHLLSDLSPIPVVRLSLMLPNITKSTLRRAFGTTVEGKDMKTMETTIDICLCADHLSHPLSPWDVDSGVMSHFREWWDRLMNSAVHGPIMTDSVYQDMIARFCGPATVSAFKIDESKVYQLPKTLNEAVMLTGDLFERVTLSPDIANLLEEPRVCLAGPPGTGKSKTLALIGKKWISEGHTVHLINTCSEGSDAITQLHKLLLQNSTGQSTVTPVKSVKRVFCNIDSSKEIEDTIKFLKNETKKTSLFALMDEPIVDQEKLKNLQVFLQNLNGRLPDLHLWLAICRFDSTLLAWKGKPLKIPFSCPPSVLRAAWKETQNTWYSTNNNWLPTDGLPVKNICHGGQGHVDKEPSDCHACGQEIVKFLTQDLRFANQDTQNATEDPQPTSHQTTVKQFPSLQWKDLLFVFENKVTEDTIMIQRLKVSGIPMKIINSKNKENVLRGDRNIVLAAKTGFMCGRKRKVVVYVESAINKSTPYDKWKRLLSITRCASQLIVVRMPRN